MTKSKGVGRGWAKGLTAAADPRIAKRAWSKGLTAATDDRIARAADAHRGRTYVRRIAPEDARWQRPWTPFTGDWSDRIAYAVGLMATDGCLVQGKKRLQFGSCDRELVELLLGSLERPARIRPTRTKADEPYYRTQFGWSTFYTWLVGVGLTPRKSRTLGAIDVPDTYLLPLARGLLDGDGTILNKTYRADTRDSKDYRWEYLQTRFLSASREHIDWLRARLLAKLGIDGYVGSETAASGTVMSVLRYGKPASVALLSALYADRDAPRLTRKWRIWEQYRLRHGLR